MTKQKPAEIYREFLIGIFFYPTDQRKKSILPSGSEPKRANHTASSCVRTV
jgi:hypothetical protein